MLWVFGTWVITSLLGLGRGHNTLFEGYDQTLSGYHLCNTTELVSETHVISYPTSYTQRRPCGGWLPWAMCDVTFYKTEFRTEFKYMPKQVKKCCLGYEQFGSYCALTLNRRAEFTSKPGLCPTAGVTGSQWSHSNSSGSVCNWDIDCPQWQKCCHTENISNISYCSDPVPLANRTWCFNVTITVKTTYEFITMEKGLFNHTRLLHSLVTGTLGNEDISVHHVWSWSAGLFTTSSSLLVCSPKVLSLEDISAKLYQLGNIEEVTDVVVQDVDECTAPELNNCSPHANCMNTEGSYFCVCHHGYHDTNSSQSGTVCTAPSVTKQPFINTTSTTNSWITHPLPSNKTYTDQGPSSTFTSGPFWTSTFVPSSHSDSLSSSRPSSACDIPVITSLLSFNVTESNFLVSWTTNIKAGVTFVLVLLRGTTELNRIVNSSEFNQIFTDLNPAVLYTVRITPSACGIQGNPVEIKVRTGGQSLRATVRLTGIEHSEGLRDPNSDKYKTFCDSVINETLLFLPQNILQLVQSKQVIIWITSLSPGSIIVNFSIIFHNGSNLNMFNISSALMESLKNSSIYVVDNSSIHIEDLNECLLAEADCSPWAYCENTFGSYICDCWSGYTDLSPSRLGRSCAVSPTATSTIHPTTNYGVTDTTTTTSAMSGHPSTVTMMSSTSTTHADAPTTALTHMTPNPVRLNITGPVLSYIAVECSLGHISVFIRRDVLSANNIPESSLYLGRPECLLNGTNATHVWLTAAWDKCGTTIDRNSTHNSVNVTLYNDVSSSMHSNVRLEVPVICTYPSRIIISTGYAPTGFLDMIKETLAGSGSFQVIVRLLNGTHPLPENYTISPNEEIVVEVGVNTTISQIKVVINKCWATSSMDSSQLPIYVFLEDGCPVPNTYTTVLQNGNDSVSLVSVKIFSFVNLDIIYLHCQIQICVEIQDNTCRPSCIMERTYRSSNVLGVTKASVGPLNRLRAETFSNNTVNTLQTVGLVLLGVGVFLFAVIAAAGLLYHKRKVGNYNLRFKPQQENFTYHVFAT